MTTNGVLLAEHDCVPEAPADAAWLGAVDDEPNVLAAYRRTLGRLFAITCAEGGAAGLGGRAHVDVVAEHHQRAKASSVIELSSDAVPFRGRRAEAEAGVRVEVIPALPALPPRRPEVQRARQEHQPGDHGGMANYGAFLQQVRGRISPPEPVPPHPPRHGRPDSYY